MQDPLVFFDLSSHEIQQLRDLVFEFDKFKQMLTNAMHEQPDLDSHPNVIKAFQNYLMTIRLTFNEEDETEEETT